MNSILRLIFFQCIVRPLVLIVIGLNVRNRELLPEKGPCVLVANHNSHLDTLVLMSLFPLKMIGRIRPVAAADYFLKNKLLSWFSLKIMGIIPLNRGRQGHREDPLKGVSEAINEGNIIILFPEGSRGEPEQLSKFKNGVAHLAKRHKDAPFIPIFLHGLGKSLPKGEAILVPFFCDVFVGKELWGENDKKVFSEKMEKSILDLKEENHLNGWIEED